MRWISSGQTTVDEYKVIWSGHDTSRTQGGDLTVLSKYDSCCKLLGSHMLYARMRHSFCYINISVFVCYALTDVADLEVRDCFYNQLNDELRRISRHKLRVILGDMNATVGSNRSRVERIVEIHISNVTNNNGYRMIELCTFHNLKSWELGFNTVQFTESLSIPTLDLYLRRSITY